MQHNWRELSPLISNETHLDPNFYLTELFPVLVEHFVLQSEHFQLISGNSSTYSLAVRHLLKRTDTTEVMEVLQREACGVLTQRRRPGTMEKGDESTNAAAAVGFHPRPQQESWRSCDYTSSSQKLTGRCCFLSLCCLTPFIVSQGESERAQCCTAEPQGEKWWKVSIQTWAARDTHTHTHTHTGQQGY